MSDYGRNFEFRIPPDGKGRSGRYAAPAALFAGNPTKGGIPIGAPVIVDTSVPATTAGTGLTVVKLAPQGYSRDAVSGAAMGILVYEYGPAAFAGDDPYLTTFADKDFAPPGAAIQMLRGDPTVKVCFTNTVARTFLGVRSYPGRTMVLGIGATPTVIVGDYLVPGLGNDNDGYWQGTADAQAGWLEITAVDAARAQVEARMLF